MEKLPTPLEIREHVDQYAGGQDDAEKVLSVAVYNHYKRVGYSAQEGGIEIKKSNIMMIGPTGSGKTYLAQTLAKFLGVPFTIADMTVVVTSNNIQQAIEGMVVELIKAAEYDIEKAQTGILFMDEIDKLVTGQNRVKGEGIQQALLKVVEGSVMNLNLGGKVVPFNTNNVLFMAGGAFVALAAIIRMRLADTRMGLLTETELVRKAETDDLSKFGFIPEFVGRMPVIVSLAALSLQELRTILTEPKNAIAKQYIKMFSLDGIELVFEEAALNEVAQTALKQKTGARGLRTILEKSMRDVMYTVPSEKNVIKVTITPEVVLGTGAAIVEYVNARSDEELVPLPPKPARSTSVHAD
jgi:ATP-dependent Clp protease ATP-binding subunit ClpX